MLAIGRMCSWLAIDQEVGCSSALRLVDDIGVPRGRQRGMRPTRARVHAKTCKISLFFNNFIQLQFSPEVQLSVDLWHQSLPESQTKC